MFLETEPWILKLERSNQDQANINDIWDVVFAFKIQTETRMSKVKDLLMEQLLMFIKQDQHIPLQSIT